MSAILVTWLVLASTGSTMKPEVVCESIAGAYRECRIATAGRIELSRELSDSLCFEGATWGTSQDGVVWVTRGCRAAFTIQDPDTPAPRKPTLSTVVCKSVDEAREHCAANTKFGVAIARELGEAECKLDRTWGFDDEGVWVSGGCQAQFALGGYRIRSSAVPSSAKRLTCESFDGKGKQCPVNTWHGVGLVNQIGKEDCVLNRTWGYDHEGIWVTKGCRAEFAVAK